MARDCRRDASFARCKRLEMSVAEVEECNSSSAELRRNILRGGRCCRRLSAALACGVQQNPLWSDAKRRKCSVVTENALGGDGQRAVDGVVD
jgi:hypothetical protein